MSIALTTNIRSILDGLNNTSALMAQTQKRLATGKKVSSAIDDPVAFFTSQALYNRASDLTAIKDRISSATNVIKAATDGLAAVEKVLLQMKGLADQASASSSTTERASYATQYDALRTQLDNITKDSSLNGVNLIKASPDSITVSYNETSTTTMTIAGIASDSAGLSVTAANSWNNATIATGTSNIAADVVLIDAALVTVRTSAATMGSNGSVLKTRLDFTSNLINTLNSGADNMTNADINSESANMLALQTRQSLAVSSLTIANQAEQSILKLFN